MEKTDREVESGTPTDNHDNEIPFHTERTPLLDYTVASSPFAGRIGGNQEFVISSRDHDAGEVLKKLPDAVGRFCGLNVACNERETDQRTGTFGLAA